MHLQAEITEGSRSLKMYAKRLEKLGIVTFQDLLYHIPSRYEDYSMISSIAQLQEGETVTLQGNVTEAKNEFTRSRKTIQKIILHDGTGEIQLIWFNQPYIIKNLSFGDTLSVSGRVEIFSRKLALISPEYEVITEGKAVHTGRIIPVYPETYGVSSKWLRRQVYTLLETHLSDVQETLPQQLITSHKLMPIQRALMEIHFPSSFETVAEARRRLSFDELFHLQLAAFERKKQWKEDKTGYAFQIGKKRSSIESLIDSLPFTLTASQSTAVDEILNELSSDKPMNRLLQGDVGSGKTVIAAIAMYAAYLDNFQSALMAPTEILAQQHYSTINTFLSPFGVKVGLITGSQKLQKDTEFDIIVGTHALLSDKLLFQRLGFVAIDEQQRFGVEQRGYLREKGSNPHILTMTATPIPRTVALTLYGELSVSFLNELPKGRKVIKTWLVPVEKRKRAYDWIRKEIRENNSQVFIICPFIEESESMQTIKAATSEYDRLQKEVFPDLKLGLLHGKLRAKEKDAVLQEFRDKQFNILVATPVVEVGIDIPNATIIVIEAAERFGLAQLHQLRGRVGRGDKQSYCLLFTESANESAITRLKAMESMHSGSALAEFDLKLRGPGEVYGLKQSGTRMLKIASYSDIDLIVTARNAAQSISQQIDSFPNLRIQIEKQLERKVTPD